MTQNIDMKLFEELEREVSQAKKKLESRAIVKNSSPALRNGSWISKIVDKVRISELASENNINECPKCSHSIYFDDTKGIFCCSYARWSSKEKCDFGGGIVDFQAFILGGRK